MCPLLKFFKWLLWSVCGSWIIAHFICPKGQLFAVSFLSTDTGNWVILHVINDGCHVANYLLWRHLYLICDLIWNLLFCCNGWPWLSCSDCIVGPQLPTNLAFDPKHKGGQLCLTNRHLQLSHQSILYYMKNSWVDYAVANWFRDHPTLFSWMWHLISSFHLCVITF